MSSNYTSDGDDEFPAEYEDDDPNNPFHRDHDLSDSASYDWDRPADDKPWFLQRWFMLIVAIALVASLLLPYAARVL